MQPSVVEQPVGRSHHRILAAIFAAILMSAGLSAVVLVSDSNPASAAVISFSQCNGRGAGPAGAPLTVTCSVSIVNEIGPSSQTSTTVYSRICTLNGCTGDIASPTDAINAVHQCNASDNVGGSVTICEVNIINNISAASPSAATALTLNQCIGSGAGGGSQMNACIASAQGSPSVVQCNGSGNGGGAFMSCVAAGTQSSAFPVFVDQCNGSENGGGSVVICSTTVTNNLFDTDTATVVPPTTERIGDVPAAPTSFPTGVPATPTGTPTAGTPPEAPGVPEAPPFVELPPGFTG